MVAIKKKHVVLKGITLLFPYNITYFAGFCAYCKLVRNTQISLQCIKLEAKIAIEIYILPISNLILKQV